MAALTAIWNSEKGVIGLALIIGATVLAALGNITADAWMSYTQWIFGIYVVGKTVQGASSALANRPAQPAPAASSGQTVAVVNNPTPGA